MYTHMQRCMTCIIPNVVVALLPSRCSSVHPHRMFVVSPVAQAAGQGPQTVLLHDKLTGSSAGEVRLTVSGGSPAISGLPHTEGAHS